MKYLFLICMVFIMASCIEEGETWKCLDGNNENLPPELKGLNVYTVGTGNGGDIKVAVLNNTVNGLKYRDGKHDKYVIILNDNKKNVIEVTEIISETDSIIVARKK